ncbi:response regulator transcription factor [Paenibacillus piri]|uniref:Response regulator n=1 Tax=Paenibacillus piri TaxID=2547395 RepID=A0A4R5KJP5_9BACL|nr:response regulator [Paenibacillus piri]TDF95048.1 response regulator [Paenibacillus piri]
MYKVILVDDEIWSLEGIRKVFDWQHMGFAIAAQTTDASEALELICSLKPDVVVTDIRMPEISGIDLLTLSRKRGITSEFIIISGFAEFAYAQEAIRYGAFDYQLKPIDPVEAKQLLTKLKLRLHEKQLAENVNTVKQLVSGACPPAEWLCERNFAPEGGAYWQVMTICGAVPDGFAEFPYAPASSAPFQPLALQLDEVQAVVIANGGQWLERDIMMYMSRWNKPGNCRIGLSRVTDEAEQLPRLIKESGMASAHHFIDERPEVIRFSAGTSFAIENIVLKTEKLIMLKDFDGICSIIDSIPDLFKTDGLGMYHATCLWNQYAFVIRKRLERDALLNRVEFLDYENIVSRFNSLSAMCEHIKGLLKVLCSSDSASGAGRSGTRNGNFIALLQQVNLNYDKPLSLSELADTHYLNMSYCSELFKKVTGYTFSDYVTKLRMEAAAELIRSGSYTAETVCSMTGYNDYYYFSKTFKKFYGVAPSKFAPTMPLPVSQSMSQ